jgi:hypothetical protein
LETIKDVTTTSTQQPSDRPRKVSWGDNTVIFPTTQTLEGALDLSEEANMAPIDATVHPLIIASGGAITTKITSLWKILLIGSVRAIVTYCYNVTFSHYILRKLLK